MTTSHQHIYLYNPGGLPSPLSRPSYVRLIVVVVVVYC